MRVLFVLAMLVIGASVAADEPKPETNTAKLRRYSEQATQLVDKLDPRHQVLVLTNVAMIRGKEAAPLLTQALGVASKSEGMERMLLLAQVARGFVLNGDLQSALDVDSLAGRGASINYIVEAQIMTGNLNDALVLANRLGDQQSRLNALTAVARAQAKAGKIDAALETADQLKASPLNQAGALREIAIALGKSKQKGKAFELLIEARELIEQVVAPEGRSDMLASFAIDQAAAGDLTGARITFDSLHLPKDKTFRGSKGYFYWRFAEEQANWGDAAGAIRFAETLPDASDRVTVILRVAKTQLARKELKSALATVELAEQVFGELRDAKERQERARLFAPLHARLGNAKRADEHLATIPDAALYIMTACEIAQEQADAGQHREAIAALRQALPKAKQIQSHHFVGPHAVHGLCEQLGRLDLDREAISLIDDVESPELKAFGWMGLARSADYRLRKPEKQ